MNALLLPVLSNPGCGRGPAFKRAGGVGGDLLVLLLNFKSRMPNWFLKSRLFPYNPRLWFVNSSNAVIRGSSPEARGGRRQERAGARRHGDCGLHAG